ncbi:hypothetical protein [Alishewanella phage vB_AspM_Slickus01]|nr:hypothetical protein [Alishewanella phage vB_AspM_Slickus01]
MKNEKNNFYSVYVYNLGGSMVLETLFLNKALAEFARIAQAIQTNDVEFAHIEKVRIWHGGEQFAIAERVKL